MNQDGEGEKVEGDECQWLGLEHVTFEVSFRQLEEMKWRQQDVG